ncbi:MAG: DMT family transporter [Rubritepida sp.]|nr:DMT family transporter [Rubritepida sp.]
MAAAACIFTMEALLVRVMVARGIPVEVQVLFRALGQAVWVAPFVLAAGRGAFATRRLPLHLLRGVCSAATWGFYYWSFTYLDLATATVLSFTNVMFTTLLAGPVLGERVGPARWAGTLAGFAGVAVMLRPGADVPLVGAAIAIAAALCWCGITLTTRSLTRTDSTLTILAWLSVVVVACALPLAALAWRPLGAGDLAWLAVFALVCPGIIWLVTEALRAGEASAVAPFQYIRLVLIAAGGWALHGEVPDAWAVLGAACILGGAVVITVAEVRRR